MAEQPIIIKRIKKGGHGHHGGAWKVAYADFMTAMMAFFLLLWLLNSVTEEQLQGISDYFAPSSMSTSSSGAGGMLGGTTIGEGAMTSQASAPSAPLTLPPPTIGSGGDAMTDPKEGAESGATEGAQDFGSGNRNDEGTNQEQNQNPPQMPSERQLQEARAQQEQKQFEQAQEALKQAINSIPELRKMADSLMVDNTPEGLRIQIVDQDGLTMFPSGSAAMFGHTRALIDLISRVVKQLPGEKIAISGHTDSVPFSGRSDFGNWELSTDRANATRRALLASGVPPDRIDRVVGRAATDPLIEKDPTNPRNRRISIVLLRNERPPGTVEVSPDQARSGRLPGGL